MALVEPGDEVLIPAPYWVSYPEQVRLCGGVPVAVATDTASGFRASVAQLESARTNRTRALVFVSPSNPTGTVYPAEEAAAIAAWAGQHGIWVITDEIYAELVYGDAAFTSLPSLVDDAGRIIVVDGVAKSYAMTGWRVGWSIAPADVADGINKLQSHVTSNVCNVAQAAALEALTGPQDAVEVMRRAFDRRRRLAVDALRAIDGVEVAEPHGAFYVFPSFEGHIGRTIQGHQIDSTLDLAAALLDIAQVAIVPGEAFGAPGYARLSYALSDEALVEGITRIGDTLS